MRQHGYRIDKAKVRNQLAPRSEPYWASLGPGRALGFRRGPVREGTWDARWTEPDGEGPGSRPKYRLSSLGSECDMDYGAAVEAGKAARLSR